MSQTSNSAKSNAKVEAKKRTNPVDPDQLLFLCHRMRETISLLEKCIKSTQLRLTTLSYINDDVEDSSLMCFDSLIELCNLSQLVIQLLDELQEKLSESSENSAQYQIASQQLMFFTSEWYDNLTPKLNETFELAQEQSFNINKLIPGSNKRKQELAPANLRVRDALLRLRESMRENERLIVNIAGNIERTRATIETIYDSLESTKLNLNAGEENAKVAINELRRTSKTRLTCILIPLLLLFSLLLMFVYRLIF